MRKQFATAQAATFLTLLSLLSPVAGLVVEVILAWNFGASGTVDAFRIASLLLVMGNQIFFGQVLPHVIVPLFLEYQAKGPYQEGWRLVFSLTWLLGLATVFLAGWIWVNPGTLLSLLGPGLDGQSQADGIVLIRFFGIALLFMMWSGVINSVLQVYRVFWLGPVTQLLTNLLLIVSIVTVGREWGEESIAFGILAGGLAMLGLHLKVLFRFLRSEKIVPGVFLQLGPWNGIAKAFRLSLPLLGMIAISQWGSILINRELSEMETGTLADFGYAFKLLALAGILASSLSVVIFPALSSAQATDNLLEFSRLVSRSVRMTMFLTIPLTVFLFVSRDPLISLMFEGGAMSRGALEETRLLFGILLTGAPAGALMVVLQKVAFSRQDTKSPVITTLFSTLALTWLIPYFAKQQGVVAVTWVYNLVLLGSVIGLFAFQIFWYRSIHFQDLAKFFGKLTVLCGGISLTAISIRYLSELTGMVGKGLALLELGFMAGLSAATGYGLAKMLKMPEMSEIWEFVLWQLDRIQSLWKQHPIYHENRTDK